jgi:hypothetical protein
MGSKQDFGVVIPEEERPFCQYAGLNEEVELRAKGYRHYRSYQRQARGDGHAKGSFADYETPPTQAGKELAEAQEYAARLPAPAALNRVFRAIEAVAKTRAGKPRKVYGKKKKHAATPEPHPPDSPG